MRERETETKRNKDRPKRSARESDRKSSEHAREANATYAIYFCVLTLFCQFLCVSFAPAHSLTIHPTLEIYKIKRRIRIIGSVKR